MRRDARGRPVWKQNAGQVEADGDDARERELGGKYTEVKIPEPVRV